MIRTLLFGFVIVAASQMLFGSAPGEIQGTVRDQDGIAQDFVDVVAVKNGYQAEATQTDLNGTYVLSLESGNYTLYFIKGGWHTDTLTGVTIRAGEVLFINRTIYPNSRVLPVIQVTWSDIKPVIDPGGKNPIFSIDEKRLDRRTGPNKVHTLTTAAGVYTSDDGERPTLGGTSRQESTAIFLNGYRFYGSLDDLPDEAISEMSVTITGVPARYGDFTGGMIEVTTRSF